MFNPNHNPNLDLLTPGYLKVISRTKFEDFGIIRFELSCGQTTRITHTHTHTLNNTTIYKAP